MNQEIFIKSFHNYIKSLKNCILNIKEEINYFIYKLIRLIYAIIEDLIL